LDDDNTLDWTTLDDDNTLDWTTLKNLAETLVKNLVLDCSDLIFVVYENIPIIIQLI